jgi:hypothetical protein
MDFVTVESSAFGAYKTEGFVAVKIENFYMPQTPCV